jgi:peptidyl-prolyl cis-trans isomerase SurA
VKYKDMNKQFLKGFVISTVAVCFAASSLISSAKTELIDRVVALVDSDVVLASELVRRTNTVIEQIKARQQTVPALDILKQQILERLVLESLQLQTAKRVGVRVSDTELDAAIARIAQDNKLSLESLRANTIGSGTDWKVFREGIRDEIMISRVRSGYVSRRVQISDKEVENLIEQINQQGESQMQYALGHILLPVAESASPEELQAVREQAQKLVKELRAGANFEEYAVSYSKGQNALQGGNLGMRSLSQLPSLFAGNVRNMKAGDISEPLRSGSGLHILHLIEVKGGFEEVKVLQTQARHILVTPDAITDDKAALAKANDLRKQIIDGADFAVLAKEHSDDKGSGALGGDLGWSDPGTFVPEFTQAMDALAVDEISQAVKTQYGYHIIQVTGRRDQDQTEERKREQAYRILHGRKFEEEAQIWLSELKEQAYIKYIDEK